MDANLTRREFLIATGGLTLAATLPINTFAESAVSDVYFTEDISSAGVLKAYETIKQHVTGRVGVKVHFGAEGNQNYLRPQLIKELVLKLNAPLVETNILYPSKRRYTESHIQLAREHGYDFAPIDILDSEADKIIKTNSKHYKEVRVGSHMDNYDTILMMTHFKGHNLAGIGGAIKNASMGLGSVAGKMALHASDIPGTFPEKCIKCGTCIKNCAGDAITIDPLKIDPKKCIGCGKCIGVCPVRAFSVPWGSTEKPIVMERLGEYAQAISNDTNLVCINVLNNISASCDCMSNAPAPFMKDIGILASTDMVAIDKACYDLVNKRHGSNDAFLQESLVSGEHQLTYAASIGLGNLAYNLHRI